MYTDYYLMRDLFERIGVKYEGMAGETIRELSTGAPSYQIPPNAAMALLADNCTTLYLFTGKGVYLGHCVHRHGFQGKKQSQPTL